MTSELARDPSQPLAMAPPLPRYLQIEPVGQCNLRCRMCAIQFRQDGPPHGPLAFMPFDDFKRLVLEFGDIEELQLQGLGEPTMHPRFFDMVAWASARGIRVSTNSNLTLWSDVLGESTYLHWHGKIRGPDFAGLTYKLREVGVGLKDRRDNDIKTIVAQPIDENEAANQVKQRLANEDVILKQIRDHPGRSLSQMARDAGWMNEAGEPNKWISQRCIDALKADKLISQPRRGAGWKLTPAGIAYLDAQT